MNSRVLHEPPISIGYIQVAVLVEYYTVPVGSALVAEAIAVRRLIRIGI